MSRTKRQQYVKEVLLNFAGVFIYAAGIYCFTAPNQIAPGGASGIAILVNYVTGCPIGLFVFLFNIPLIGIILYQRNFPHGFVWRMLASTLLLAVVTDYIVVYLPVYDTNPLMAAMFGGAMMGTGLALINIGKSDTGGISLLGLILREFYPQFQVGKLITVLNMGVAFASVFFYRNMESLLYAVLTVYIAGKFMDGIIDNTEAKSLMIIIAESTDKVREVFLNINAGITVLKGEGGYSSEMQRVVLCVTEKKRCEYIQKQIREIDDKALVIITEAEKVRGKRYKHLI